MLLTLAFRQPFDCSTGDLIGLPFEPRLTVSRLVSATPDPSRVGST